jgi:saccharopine dehydrogenase-like NADP-dependent oxidoreductase
MQRNKNKVLALGCAGGVGSVAVFELSRMHPYLEICIADRNEEAARSLASRLGGLVTALHLDVTNTDALNQALSEVKLVINAVGPYYRFGVPVLQAAIANDCDYIDICDDTQPTLQMLELHSQAQARGVKAIIGAGASPGISSLLSVKAIETLDSVEHLFTGWNFVQAAIGEVDKPQAGAALEHTLHETSGEIALYRNGQLRQVPALQKVTVPYPGLGDFDAYTFGHPEPVTLPRYFPKVKNTANVSYMPSSIVQVLQQTGKAYQMQHINLSAAVQQLQSGIQQAMASMNETEATLTENVPPLFVLAVGERNQQAIMIAATLATYPISKWEGATMMTATTGVPLAVAASMVLEGCVVQTGVMAPEISLPTEVFFEKLWPYCTASKSSMDEWLMIASSEAVRMQNK